MTILKSIIYTTRIIILQYKLDHISILIKTRNVLSHFAKMGTSDIIPDKTLYDSVPAYLSFSYLLCMPFLLSLMPLFLPCLPIILFSEFSHRWVVFSFNSPLKCHLSRLPTSQTSHPVTITFSSLRVLQSTYHYLWHFFLICLLLITISGSIRY